MNLTQNRCYLLDLSFLRPQQVCIALYSVFHFVRLEAGLFRKGSIKGHVIFDVTLAAYSKE